MQEKYHQEFRAYFTTDLRRRAMQSMTQEEMAKLLETARAIWPIWSLHVAALFFPAPFWQGILSG